MSVYENPENFAKKKNISLYKEDRKIIDTFSKLYDVSQSEFIRMALEFYKKEFIDEFVTETKRKILKEK